MIRLRVLTACCLALSFVLGACRGPKLPAEVAILSDDEILERARGLLESDPEDCLVHTEALLERSGVADILQESLFLAGMSHLSLDESKKAFRKFEALVQDYAGSDFVSLVEEPLYDIGQAYIQRSPWKVFGDLFSGRPFGVEVLRLYAGTYPYSERADDALISVGEYYESREEYLLAADKFSLVVERYSASEWFDYAAYREGRDYQLESRGAGYDGSLMRRARAAYLRDLARPEGSGFRQQVEEGLREAEEALAGGELAVARFYLLRDQDRGARLHLANAVLAFPGTEASAEARQELEEHGWDLSINSLDTLQPRIGE